MMFKNSIKLLCTNFDKVWKLLVYHIFCIGICFGLLSVFYGQYTEILDVVYHSSGLSEIFQSGTIFGGTLTEALKTIANFIIMFFKEMFLRDIGHGVYFCFVVLYFLPFLMNIGKYVTCEMMYGYMSSCQRQSFAATFIKTLGKSISYASVKVIYAMPFNAIVLVCLWALTRAQSNIYDYVMPFLFVIIPSVLLPIKGLFNAGWAPAMVVYNHNVISSFGIGIRATFRRIDKVYSNLFVIYLLAIVLSIVLGAYSVLIILPVIFPLVHIFDMVMFFTSQGMRFYEDADTIISPKKLEEVDKIEDAKFLL